MSVLDRSALVESPLADLHTIASELSIDGFRRLRRDELIDAIIEKQGGDPAEGKADQPEEESTTTTRRRRSRRGGRAAADTDTESEPEPEQAVAAPAESEAEAEEAPKPRRARSRSRKSEPEEAPKEEATTEPDDVEEEKPVRSRRGRAKATEERPESADADEETVEGTVEVLANGSGFVRLGGSPDGDVYISSAQVKRCELVSGDTVTGPKRSPRRSERYASLIRIETINGRPASEQADTVRFDDLPAALPSDLIDLAGADAALKAVQAVAPFGRGSRVTITGPSRAGKTELLRTIAAGLSGQSELTVSVALAGVRPEEIGAWSADGEPALPAPAGAVSLAASEDARAGALEPVVDQARRLAARGTHAVVLIDTLDGLSAYAARKLIAAARNITDGGSVTIIATAGQPVGGETTVIALDLAGATTGRFPAIDALASGTLRPERLVGDTAARKIIRDRAKALKET
ncbi:MAG TPA: Rho termination factor N-terminal domain-containing protein [Solirubrobacteraceae bacterium]|jgi:transcription termination factor Rho